MLTEPEIDRFLDCLGESSDWELWASRIRVCRSKQSQRYQDNFIQIPFEKDAFTESVVDAFARFGWSVHVVPNSHFPEWHFGSAIVGPMQIVNSPQFCFHATPVENVSNIREHGILRGIDADRSTTNRSDAQFYIHVSFSEEHAEEWANGTERLSKNHDGEFAVLEVDMAEIEDSTFKDPFSPDGKGYIINKSLIEPWRIQSQERGFSI